MGPRALPHCRGSRQAPWRIRLQHAGHSMRCGRSARRHGRCACAGGGRCVQRWRQGGQYWLAALLAASRAGPCLESPEGKGRQVWLQPGNADSDDHDAHQPAASLVGQRRRRCTRQHEAGPRCIQRRRRGRRISGSCLLPRSRAVDGRMRRLLHFLHALSRVQTHGTESNYAPRLDQAWGKGYTRTGFDAGCVCGCVKVSAARQEQLATVGARQAGRRGGRLKNG